MILILIYFFTFVFSPPLSLFLSLNVCTHVPMGESGGQRKIVAIDSLLLSCGFELRSSGVVASFFTHWVNSLDWGWFIFCHGPFFFFNVERYLIIRIYHNRFIYNRFLCSFVKEQFSYLQFDPLCTKHEWIFLEESYSEHSYLLLLGRSKISES